MYNSYAEIFQQGEALRKTYDALLQQQAAIKRFFLEAEYHEIVFVACGSSYWLSLAAAMSMQEKLGIRCCAVKSGEIVMNPEYYKRAFDAPLFIAPSRSGNTSETLVAIDLLRAAYGSNVLSIVVYEDSALEMKSDLVLRLPWCNEISVCQTRSFSNLYLATVMISALVSADEALLSDFNRYIGRFDTYSAEAERALRSVTEDFPQCNALAVLGSGKTYGVAIEGAYIAIEMAAFHANYYSVLEYRHGPIVTADDNALVFILCAKGNCKFEEQMAAEARNRGAKVGMIADDYCPQNADYRFILGDAFVPEAAALFGIMVLQGFAYFKAKSLGLDPDHPKELVPWIKINI